MKCAQLDVHWEKVSIKNPHPPPLTINVSSLSTHALKQSFLFCHHGSPPVPDQVFSDYQDGNSLGKTEQRRSCFSGGEGGSVTEALILNFFFVCFAYLSLLVSSCKRADVQTRAVDVELIPEWRGSGPRG